MARVPFPTDEKSADIALGRFMENAFSISYKETFSRAVSLKHGPFFLIRQDSSSRMFFYCTICKKDMNNVKALNEHAYSGNHIKNKDSENEGKWFKSSNKSYHHSSLQHKIISTEDLLPVLGLQRVEAYDSGRGHYYYKCILCGAHGKVDIIFRHLTGDKHTDKYIRSRIVLKSPTISNEERVMLRERIFQHEKYTLEYIQTIRGSEFYPWKWESQWRDSKRREIKREDSPRNSSYIDRNTENDIKGKPLKTERTNEDSETEMGSPPTTPADEAEKTKPNTVDKAIQAYSYGFLNSILLKFNVIVKVHLMKDTDLHSPEDLRVALNILRYALHLLFHSFEKEQQFSVDHDTTGVQNTTKSCLGYVMRRLIPYFERKYGKL